MSILGGLKRVVMDRVIAGTLKKAAEGQYGAAVKGSYWWVERNALPISLVLGGLQAGLAYLCSHGGASFAWACSLDTGMVGPGFTGVLGLLGLTVGAHASDAPKDPPK
jgi:hypothetical protein